MVSEPLQSPCVCFLDLTEPGIPSLLAVQTPGPWAVGLLPSVLSAKLKHPPQIAVTSYLELLPLSPVKPLMGLFVLSVARPHLCSSPLWSSFPILADLAFPLLLLLQWTKRSLLPRDLKVTDAHVLWSQDNCWCPCEMNSLPNGRWGRPRTKEEVRDVLKMLAVSWRGIPDTRIST